MFQKLAGLVAISLLSSIVGAAFYAYFFQPEVKVIRSSTVPPVFSSYNAPAVAETEGNLPDFVPAAGRARRAVVHIRSYFERKRKKGRSNFFGNPFRYHYDEKDPYEDQSGVMASGSGVFISSDGYIATNNHVIEDAKRIEVTLINNETYKARLIGRDKFTDLALLKIEGKLFPKLEFGNSDELQIGEWVLAVGNPMELTSTVTTGIVSAKGRNLKLLNSGNSSNASISIESFIQTDAVVNKGNSGGALVNTEGELVGINTAIASKTGYYAGYSFAIPVSIVSKIMEDLLRYGEVRRGFLGIQTETINSELGDQVGLYTLQGAYVKFVEPNSGADDAGLKPGDVINSINGVSVQSAAELIEQICRFRPGDKLEVGGMRGKNILSLRVTLKTMNNKSMVSHAPTRLDFEGSSFRVLSPRELEEEGLYHGILLEQVGGFFLRNGILEGFIIKEVNKEPIHGITQLKRILEEASGIMNIRGRYKDGGAATYNFLVDD